MRPTAKERTCAHARCLQPRATISGWLRGVSCGWCLRTSSMTEVTPRGRERLPRAEPRVRNMGRIRQRRLSLRLVLPTAVLTAVLAAALIGLQLHEAQERAAEDLDRYADLVGGVVSDGLHDS